MFSEDPRISPRLTEMTGGYISSLSLARTRQAYGNFYDPHEETPRFSM